MPPRTHPIIVSSLLAAATAHATYYFDTNGATAGFGIIDTGQWSNTSSQSPQWDLNTTAFWTNSDTGESATGTWQTVTGLNGSTVVTVDQNVSFNPPGASRIRFGDQNAGTNFIVDFGSFDLIRTNATGTLRIQNGTDTPDRNGILRFGGGNINVTTGTLAFGGPAISGSFTKIGAGSLDVSTPADGAGLTNILISEGNLRIGGTPAVNSGTSVQNNSSLTVATNFTLGSLTGSGNIALAGVSTSNFTLTIDNTTDQTFGGSTPTGTRTLNFVKSGTAEYELTSASQQHIGTTTVEEGTLIQNGIHTGAGEYIVQNGGTLEGTGSITTADANFTVENGGRLSPGNSPGTMTVALGTGTFDLTGIGAEALVFEVGDAVSDSIVLTTGTLDIGTLDFDEFLFSDIGDLTDGTILTLFDTNETIVGNIGTAVGIFDDFSGTLGFADGGQDIILTVSAAVPEPSTYALLLGAAMLSLVAIRRKRA